jgi:Flp pilus assembly protein TadG
MLYRRARVLRRGAVLVESAVVYPLLFLLLFGLIIGGLGVFRYQQVACQAREAARWTSVRGANWPKRTGSPCPTVADITSAAVTPLAAGMNPQSLSVQVQVIDLVHGTATDWDASDKAPVTMTNTGDQVTNRVRVTVTYQWMPELFLAGPLNLKSVSELAMAY